MDSIVPRVSLAPYALRLKTGAGNNKVYHYPDALPGGMTLRGLLDDYLEHLEESFRQDDDVQKILGAQQVTRNGRTVYGLFRSGEWGYGSTLLDVDGLEDPYERQPNQAEVLPFFFAHHYTPERTQTILLLQKFRQYGVASVFSRDFERYAREQGLDVDVELNPLVPPNYVEQLFEDGRLKSIQFIKHEIPQDLLDVFQDGTAEVPGNLMIEVSTSRAGSLPWRNWLQNRLDMAHAEQIEVLDIPMDEIKVKITKDGAARTVDLSDLHAIRPAYNVSNLVEYGEDGHPTFQTIRAAGLNIMQELRTANWQNEDNEEE